MCAPVAWWAQSVSTSAEQPSWPEESERKPNDFLGSVNIVGLDEETARLFGRERGQLRRTGAMIGDMDLLIAATALQYDLTLLTNNPSPF